MSGMKKGEWQLGIWDFLFEYEVFGIFFFFLIEDGFVWFEISLNVFKCV